MRHHRIAVVTIIAAVAAEVMLGSVFAVADHVPWGDGLFLAMAIGSTSGYAQVAVHGWLPHLLVAGMFWIIVPLIAATFSLFTSALAGQHVRKARDEIKVHVDQNLDPGAHHARLAEKLERLADSHDELTKTVRALVNPSRWGEEQRAAAEPPPAVVPEAISRTIEGEPMQRTPRKPRVRKPTAPAARENT